MAASAEERAQLSRDAEISARSELERARAKHADAYLRYIRDALEAHWRWRRIATEIGVTPKAVRWYWNEHRHRAGRLGSVQAPSQATRSE